MARAKKESKQAPTVRRSFGFVILCAILLYLVASLIMYLTAHRITSYEVTIGHLSQNEIYNGIALRDEQVVNADQSGYVYYYAQEGEKVRVGTEVYTVDSDGEKTKSLLTDSSEVKFTEKDLSLIEPLMIGFQEDYANVYYDRVYDFSYELDSELIDKGNANIADRLHEIAKQNPSQFFVNTSPVDGIISYQVDGMEGFTPNQLTADNFAMKDYVVQDLRLAEQIESGNAAYKIVKTDHWQVCVPVSEATYQQMVEDERSEVYVRFLKDNVKTWADLELTQSGGVPMAILSFDEAMIRYLQNRYLEVELIFQDKEGLKIPQSAVVNKNFFTVPLEYITQGGDSSQDGIMLLREDQTPVFTPVTIYYVDEEKSLAYLDQSMIHANDQIMKPESTEKYVISDMAPLEGVYNINKGYAAFRRIETIYQNDEYRIIQEGTKYGISCYDFIALDQKDVIEDDIVY